MRMDREKLRFILLAAASLAGILLLAAALDGFSFASPFQLAETESAGGVDPSVRDLLMRLALLLIFAMLPMVTILLILVSRRRLRILFFLLLVLLFAYLIAISDTGELPTTEEALSTITPEVLQSESITPQPTLATLPLPAEVGVTPTLVWLLSLGLAAALGGVIVLGWLVWRGFRRRASPLQEIVASAENALQALEQGEDVQTTVLGCYRSMLAAAERSKGLERPDYLTPAEFVQRLVHAGLPRTPVERLTRLFESVRYSPQPATPVMETEAVLCLRDVIAAAKEEA